MTQAKRDSSRRLTVRFDTDRVEALVARGRNAGQKIGTVLHYVEEPRKTPTGGRYTARQFTLRTPGGDLWFGTLPKDSDIVKLRPATQAEVDKLREKNQAAADARKAKANEQRETA